MSTADFPLASAPTTYRFHFAIVLHFPAFTNTLPLPARGAPSPISNCRTLRKTHVSVNASHDPDFAYRESPFLPLHARQQALLCDSCSEGEPSMKLRKAHYH